MTRNPRSSGRGRFARRVVALFVVSSLVPTLLLCTLSLWQTERLLEETTWRELRRDSHTTGQELVARIELAKEELRLRQDRVTGPLGNGGRVTLLPEVPEAIAAGLDAGQRARLDSGQTVLAVAPGSAQRAEVLILMRLSAPGTAPRLSAAAITPGYLWDLPDDDARHYCVTSSTGTAIWCESPFAGSGLALAPSQRAPGTVSWDAPSGQRYRGYRFELPLEATHGTPDWSVLVAVAEAHMLAPLARFRALSLAAAGVSLLLVTLLAVSQIRRSTVPLANLIAGTRRIAQGDFGTAVEVERADEFGELATSFNQMTARIGHQFHALETMSAIDRLILSTPDPGHVVEVLVDRIPDIVDCREVAIAALAEGAGSEALLRTRRRDEPASPPACITFPEPELEFLRSLTDPITLSRGTRFASFLEPATDLCCEHWMLLPVKVSERLCALIALGFDEAPDIEREAAERVRQLSDRAAVALSNATWEERLYQQAHYDVLTGLPNRSLLHDRLDQAIVRARRMDTVVGVLFLDLDRFKSINDTLGHAAGDELLKKVAERLQAAVRAVDTVVRFGGDEFVIILSDIPKDASMLSRASRVAESLLTALDVPVMIRDREVPVRCSIGIALFPKDAHDSDDLLRNADTALYHAKAMGRGNYHFFSTDIDSTSNARVELAGRLEQAMEEDELVLEYLPKIDLASAQVVGAECLVRWHHPTDGTISPLTLFSVAEDAGLTEQLGRWIVRTACAQLRVWNDRGQAPLTLSINLSRREFRSRHIARVVVDALVDSGVPAEQLEIELPETLIMTEIDRTMSTLREMVSAGVRVVIDDFGTGFTSVSHLAQYPVDGLKIDRAFVRDALSREAARQVIAGTVGLAERLQLEVVAEGVESCEQAALVKALGCHAAQGHWVGRPVPAKTLTAWLDNWDADARLREMAQAQTQARTADSADDAIDPTLALDGADDTADPEMVDGAVPRAVA